MRQHNFITVLYVSTFWILVYITFVNVFSIFTNIRKARFPKASRVVYKTPGETMRQSDHSAGVTSGFPYNTTGVCDALQRLTFPDSVFKYNCTMLFHNNVTEAHRALKYRRVPLDEKGYLNSLKGSCDELIRSHNYIVEPLNDEEANFPIAYSLLIFTFSEQVGRLLRAIYRPQNYYCIHVDRKADYFFYLTILRIADCFPNVFMASKRLDVESGDFSVLEPEVNCMRQLLAYKKWRYFINLTGMMYPLKTNWEIVQILKALEGANLINAIFDR